MAKTKKNIKPAPATAAKAAGKSGQIKRETVWLIAVVCLVTGFVGGVVFGVYRSGSMQPVAHPEAGGGMPPVAGGGGAGDADSRRMIAEFEAKVEKEPENLEAWTHLAHLYFDTGQVDSAIAAYRRVLELDKQNPDIWTDLGVMYRRAKRPQEAIEAFKEAIALKPEHEIARYNMGVVLLHDLEDRPGALAAWEGLLAINPAAKGPGGTSVKEMVAQMKKEAS